MQPGELRALIPSWEIHLRAERKTDGTIKTYLDGVRPYLGWCEEQQLDPLASVSLKAWTSSLLEGGRSASTAKTRMMGVRHYGRWLADEGEIEVNPFEKVKAPKVDQPIVPVLSEDQLRALIKACQPPTDQRTGLPSLRHRRDEAIIRLMTETGVRATECINLAVADVDVQAGAGVVRRGKGGKGRPIAFGASTAKALDRYLRVRRLHKLAESPPLWLGDRGRLLAYNGLYWALGERAKTAGITDFNPHMLRHTFSDRWIEKGGSEIGLVAAGGWSGLDMVQQRYGKANREKRAIEESRRLNLGDL